MRSAATVFVKDLDRMAAFYGACFGLEPVAEAPGDYRVLESECWTLSIVQVPPAVAADITLTNPPARREASPIKLSFEVSSIAAVRAAITDLGGQVDSHEWEFRGFRQCNFIDPEGNVNEVREAVTTRP